LSALRAVERIVGYCEHGRRQLLFGWRMRVSRTQTRRRSFRRSCAGTRSAAVAGAAARPSCGSTTVLVGPAVAGGWWVRAEALAGAVANVGIAVGSRRTVDATSRLP